MALVYIVEDEEDIREIEEVALKNGNHQVKGFSCAKDFYSELNVQIPDLCLLDVMLPDESGNEIIKKLKKNPSYKNVPIILVTAKTSDFDLAKGLEEGADDYIKKPFSIVELISRVNALLRRTQKLDSLQLQLDDLIIDNQKHIVLIKNQKIDLTFKEYELLFYLLENKGIVLKRESIMEKVWGTDFEGESRTIDMHIKTLRQKLGDYGNRIKTIRNVGYSIE